MYVINTLILFELLAYYYYYVGLLLWTLDHMTHLLVATDYRLFYIAKILYKNNLHDSIIH